MVRGTIEEWLRTCDLRWAQVRRRWAVTGMAARLGKAIAQAKCAACIEAMEQIGRAHV